MTTKEAVELYRHAYKKASDEEWEDYQKAHAAPEESRKRPPTGLASQRLYSKGNH